MNIFLPDHTEILKAFNDHEVEYILIGGYAVIFHGYDRTTGDMDIWLKPDNENKLKIIVALGEVGYDDESLDELNNFDFTTAVMFYLGLEPQKIEFITKLSLLNFDESNARKTFCHIDDEFKVPVLHFNDLILSKFNTGRTKDKADIEELQKIKNRKDNQ
ncbi:MAG: DUF6036 family nucleotidyltransferase [Saprospiraceae bacterium]|jgi:predicted nucleotidyltransferase|nr:hypothetical protein [Saprospiraceae bacterium]